MKQTINYNIHDILKCQIVRRRQHDWLKDLNLPLSFFEVDEIDKPDIILNIGRFTPSNKGGYIVDHIYHIGEDYFYGRDTGGTASWEVEILGLEQGSTIVNFNSRNLEPEAMLYSDELPQNILLTPLIEYKLSQKGYPMIHSAAVSKEGQAYLLTGRSGTFKTSIIMDLIRQAGVSYIADDRVIIHRGKAFSFPMRFLGFNFLSQTLPNEELQGFRDRVRLIRYLRTNRDYANCSVPVVESAPVKVLIFIARTNRQGIRKGDVPRQEAINRLVINSQAEMMKSHSFRFFDWGYHFYKYMLAYCFIFPNSRVARYWDDLRDNLEKALPQIPIYEIEIPARYDLTVLNEIRKLIETVK